MACYVEKTIINSFGIDIASIKWAHISSFPLVRKILNGKRIEAVKNILRQTLFTIFLIGGASLATFAQSNDNPPPKETKPVIPVKPKETPKPTPTPNKPRNTSAELSADLRRITITIS